MTQNPVLLFDGDCYFCRRWIERWRFYTKDAVDYRPYQEASPEYPEITIEQFKKSVWFVDRSKKIQASGAEAVFRALAEGRGKGWMLWIYQKVPLVKPVCEAAYKAVASNRSFFSKWTRFFWGESVMPSSYSVSRFVFLRLLALTYAAAFISLGIQILGLIGKDGILPAENFLAMVREHVGSERYWRVPSLAWLSVSDSALQSLCWGGAFLCLLLFLGFLPSVTLALLWFFYLSLVSVGQDFLSFQWDSLLLEAGFLTIFYAPPVLWDKFRPRGNPPALIHGLFVWLLFRLMFSSGVVKLASGDAAWHDLSALSFHYETQPLPPWTAWFMHQLPLWFQKFSTVLMFVIELAMPFLFFLPRRPRLVGAALIVGLQVMIMITGNYCFFNFLSIALCVLLIDDAFWFSKFPRKRGEPRENQRVPLCVSVPVFILIVTLSWVPMQRLALRQPAQDSGLWLFYRSVSAFRLVNPYGLFAIMTTQRPEISVEGSNDGLVWKAYEFKYKPQDIYRRPGFAQPHQPRLDWQMWFAALGSVRQNPWFIDFCVKLLRGSEEVTGLLETNPFKGAPPKYIRASLYRYHFTSAAERQKTGAWWKREESGFYMPGISLRAGADDV